MRRNGPGLVRTMGRTAVIAGTATVTSAAVGGAMQKRAMGKQAAAQQQALAQQEALAQEEAAVQEQAAEAQPAAEPAATAPAPSGALTQETIDKLKQLADLKAAGILTDEEFEQQKTRLLT